MRTHKRHFLIPVGSALLMGTLLASCGGGGGGGSPTSTPAPAPLPASYEISVTVKGLNGQPIVLGNGASRISVAQNGSARFPSQAAGSAYDVSVVAAPGYACNVSNGAGSASAADSGKAVVDCLPLLLAGAEAALHYPSGFALDKAGNTFVIDSRRQVILKVTPAGQIVTLAGSPLQYGSRDGVGAAASFHFDSESRMIIDGADNLIVADTCNNVLRKVTPAGVVSTLAGTPRKVCGNVPTDIEVRDGSGAAALFDRPSKLALDTNGDYLVLEQRKSYRRVTPAGVVSTGRWVDEPGATAPLDMPQHLAVGKGGVLYASTASYIYTISNGVARVVAGGGQEEASDGQGKAANFSRLTAMVSDAAGDLYLSDSSTLRKMTASGMVSSLTGKPVENDDKPRDGATATAILSTDNLLALDPAGNIVLLDRENALLRTVTRAGAVSTSAATPLVKDSVDGQYRSARFFNTRRLAVNAAGMLYITDPSNAIVRQVHPEGVVSTFAGIKGSTELSPNQVRFSLPRAVAVDPQGLVYVADNRWIARIDATGYRAVMTESPLVRGTSSIAVDAGGNLVAALEGKVMRVSASGQVTELINAQAVQAASGLPARPGTFAPSGLTFDSAGNLFIADSVSATILKLSTAGQLSVFAGTPGLEGDADGPRGQARLGFYTTVQMTFAPNGDMYMSGHGKVRRVTPDGTVSTPVLAWGHPDINYLIYSNGKLLGMTPFAILQTPLPK